MTTTATACGLTAVLFASLALADMADPIQMPTTPAWLTAVLAGLGTALVLATVRHDRRGHAQTVDARMVFGVGLAVGMLAGSLLAFPHTVLMSVIWVIAKFTGGSGSFEVDPVWPVVAAHILNVAAVLLLASWLLRQWRASRGRCVSCGRVDAVPPSAKHRDRLPWVAALAVASSLPYALLKLSWGLGWHIGLTGHAFDDVSLTSPGFGDTVALTLVSVLACVVMGTSVQQRPARRFALAIGGLGSAMLVPIGVVGAVMFGLVAFGQREVDGSEIAPWVFVVVYLSFLAWGTALAWLTTTYWRSTRPVCIQDHHRSIRLGVS